MLQGEIGPIWHLSCILGRKIGNDANERHTRGRLSAGSPAKVTFLRDTALLSLYEETVTPLQHGEQRWEVMWTAEIIADRKTSLLPVREERESSAERGSIRRQMQDCKCPGWDSITLILYEFLTTAFKKREENKSILRLSKQTEKVFRLLQGCFFFIIFIYLFFTQVHKIGWFEMEMHLLKKMGVAALSSLFSSYSTFSSADLISL